MLIIHEIGHTAMYFLLAIILMHCLNIKKVPWKLLLFGYFVSVFIDSDHLLDYFIYKNALTLNIKEFLTSDYFSANGKIYVLFHAWEWVLLLIVSYFVTRKKYPAVLFVATGLIAQLIFDTISHGFDPRVYLITYRIINNFSNLIFHTLY